MTTISIIAIVDDDDGIRMAIAGLVRSAGFEVQQFASANSYLESPARDTFDCVLSDIKMEGADGLELLEIIKAHDPQMPVLIMTALPDPALEQLAISKGAAFFLGKPFEADLLIDCLEKAISGQCQAKA